MEAAGDLAEVDFTLEIPFVRLRAVEGIAHDDREIHHRHSAAYQLGRAAAAGAGFDPCAHTPYEKLAKKELKDAVDLYIRVAKQAGLTGRTGCRKRSPIIDPPEFYSRRIHDEHCYL